jgi:hypothetical protein
MRGAKYVHRDATLAGEIEEGWIDETDLVLPSMDTGSNFVVHPETALAGDGDVTPPRDR